MQQLSEVQVPVMEHRPGREEGVSPSGDETNRPAAAALRSDTQTPAGRKRSGVRKQILCFSSVTGR